MNVVAQQHISGLSPYQAGMPIDHVARKYGLDPKNIIKLASNENPLGMSPKAEDAITHFMPREGHLYPDQYALTQKLAAKFGVPPECIILGNGSNDIIDLVARTFVGHGKEGVTARYAFVAHQIAILASGGKSVVVQDKDYGHDLGAMLAAITPDTGMVSVVNPNNPTGNLLSPADVEAFIKRVPQHVVVVLDEAYHEYLSTDDKTGSMHWPAKYPNLVVTRTFSKVYGLAGLRVGFGVGSPEVIDVLNRVRLPFNVNALGLAAATAAVDDDDFIARSVALNNAGSEQLREGFAQLGIEHLPIHGNFVAFKIGEKAQQVQEEVLKRGVILRGLVPYDMREYIRVSIGTNEENQRFLSALKEAMAAAV